MSGWRRVFARLGVDLRRGEDMAAGLLFAYSVLLFASFYAAKAVRQSMFIDSLGAARLPWVYLLVAATAFPTMLFYGRIVERLRQHQLIALWAAVIAASLVAFYGLWPLAWRWLPAAFYLWITIMFTVTVSQLWSFANHIFDPRQAKRLFGFVASGGALGGLAGGQVARLAADAADTRFALLVIAGMMVTIAGLVYLIAALCPVGGERVAGARASALEEARGAGEIMRRSTYLQLIAAIMLLTVMVAQVVDLQFNWVVEASTAGLEQRTAVYGNFYSLVGLGAFVFHLLLTGRIQRRLGVTFSMRVLPVTLAVGTIGLLIAAGLGLAPAAMVVIAWGLKIGDGGLRHSLDQVTRELLFLPVPSAARLKGKAFIDVFVQRSAKGVAALTLLTVTFGWISPIQASWLTLALIILWLAATEGARRLYLRSYREGLPEGILDSAAGLDFSQATTIEVLVQSLGSPDPRQVLHSLELLRAHGRGRLVPPVLLNHDDAEVRHHTLEILAAEGRRDAVPLIERRLGDVDTEVRAQAVFALAALLGEEAWEIMLPRLRNPDPRVRAAAVACLTDHRDPSVSSQAATVLSEMLRDAECEVRAEAAKAVGAMPEPACQAELVQLLYDSDSAVAREAILAVGRRARSCAGLPVLYAPILIALMRDRRLKHDCREALVASGEAVIPALVHFMKDPDEQIWVRRAAPKTIAGIGGAAAANALLDNLGATDSFLRGKVIEALCGLRSAGVEVGSGNRRIQRQIGQEAREYLQHLAQLSAVGTEEQMRFESIGLLWRVPGPRPTLLEQLLADRMADRVKHLLALLELIHAPRDIRAARRGLLSGRAAARNLALEYLDNKLAGEVRRHEKLHRAERLFGITVQPQQETLQELALNGDAGDPDRPVLAAAVLHAIYAKRILALYPLVNRVQDETSDELVRETASWVLERVEEAVPPGADP
jgi:ATP/ADP translocase/HEAT repeat protein